MKDYSFGNYICALRTGLGLSQFQLGTLVGVTDKAVSKWENGDAKPRIAACHRLAEVLGISVSELLSCGKSTTIPTRKEMQQMNRTLWQEAYSRLSIYGNTPPVACWSRLAAEEAALQGTNAIQTFAVLGKIAEAAKKHNTVITVCGAINASYAAWLMGATVVNPLKPHYHCPECGQVTFVPDAADGFDLPAKKCACGAELLRDGHNIPYEGYVRPRHATAAVQVSVSEAFLPIAAQTVIDFYAGTAEVLPVKTAEHSKDNSERYVVFDPGKTRPAVGPDGFWHATAEEFFRWCDDQTVFTFRPLRRLEEIDRQQNRSGLPLPSLQTLLQPDMAAALYREKARTLSFITDCLPEDTAIDFDLLMRIELLSHTANAWVDCGEALVRNGTAAFRDLPASREDIWHIIVSALDREGVQERGLALYLMEQVTKGTFSVQGLSEHLLQSLPLPGWLPEYMKHVRYLFPKGHCVACLYADLLYTWYTC